MKTKTSLILTVAALALSGSALAEVKIALVAKSLGNGFFEAANVGAQQAAKELGDVKVIYTGPTVPAAIPLRLENQYFSLDVSHPLATEMLQSGTCMFYVPGMLGEPELELFAVLRT